MVYQSRIAWYRNFLDGCRNSRVHISWTLIFRLKFSTLDLIFTVFLIWTPWIFLQAPDAAAIIFQMHQILWNNSTGNQFLLQGSKHSTIRGQPSYRVWKGKGHFWTSNLVCSKPSRKFPLPYRYPGTRVPWCQTNSNKVLSSTFLLTDIFEFVDVFTNL